MGCVLMPELWTPSGGVNRKLKELYTPSGGVNRKLKELYAVSGGVNRKVFSGLDATVTAIVVHVWGSADQYEVTIGEDGSVYLLLYRGGNNGNQGGALSYSVAITYQTPETLAWTSGGEIIGVDNLKSMQTDGSNNPRLHGVSPATNTAYFDYSVGNYSLKTSSAGTGSIFTLEVVVALSSSTITAGRYSMSWPAGALRLVGKTIAAVENKATIQVVQHVYDND